MKAQHFSGGRLVWEQDLSRGTEQRYDANGNIISERPLTADEIAALTPPPVVPTPEQKIEAAAAALAALDNITAPVLPVDVLDILTDVRTALEG